MDKQSRQNLINKYTKEVGLIPYGITFIDGRILFKLDSKYSKFWYGICHYSSEVFLITPLDYQIPTMLTQILVSPSTGYCERACSCLNYTCILNKFDKNSYLAQFKDCGAFSLGLPLNMGKDKPLWFNTGKYKTSWEKFIIPKDGGVLRYNNG